MGTYINIVIAYVCRLPSRNIHAQTYVHTYIHLLKIKMESLFQGWKMKSTPHQIWRHYYANL